jgi:hypothetical protein
MTRDAAALDKNIKRLVSGRTMRQVACHDLEQPTFLDPGSGFVKTVGPCAVHRRSGAQPASFDEARSY